jgi:hypothetical protein
MKGKVIGSGSSRLRMENANACACRVGFDFNRGDLPDAKRLST